MILVTGATGFVGKALVEKLLGNGESVRVLVRSMGHHHFINCDEKFIAGLDVPPDIFHGVKTVIHLAARAHVMSENSNEEENLYWGPNVDLTCALAMQAAKAGVERFVFLSTAKVFGEGLAANGAYSEYSIPSPVGQYSESKLAAEESLTTIAKSTNMELVIIRPPLVYGPGVRANFLTLMRVVSSGFPMPFKGFENKRSMISLVNLIDFICLCTKHKAASNQIFTISDGCDLTISELIVLISSFMGRGPRMFKLPTFLITFLPKCKLTQKFYDRIFRSFVVDPSKAYTLLGWSPPMNVQEGIKQAVKSFMKVN